MHRLEPFMSSLSYPWTNLDNNNLDWFIGAMQKLIEDWKEQKMDLDQMRAWLMEYLTEYDNHIRQEILTEFLESNALRAKVIEIIHQQNQ